MKIKILKKCISLAQKSNFRERSAKNQPFRIGAVVFKASSILGVGCNGIRSCKKIKNKYKNHINSLHAEQMAILNVKNRDKLNKASIVIIRINNQNELKLAKPCEMCLAFIKYVGIKKVYYSTNDGQIVLMKV